MSISRQHHICIPVSKVWQHTRKPQSLSLTCRRSLYVPRPSGIDQIGLPSLRNNTARITGTWFVSDPANTKPDDILGQLPKLLTDKRQRFTSALFLVTPGLARWFTNDNPFHQDVINQIYSPVLSKCSPTSFVAVVDALPASYSSGEGASYVVLPYEGFAICLMPDVIEAKPAVDSQQDQALIRFHSGAGHKVHEDTPIISATISTANTLFLNGSVSTMFKQAWQHEGDGWSYHGNPVSLKRISMPIPRSAQSFAGYEVPLQPMTQARKIITSMGNVLREVEGDNGAILRASTELEEKVPEFLKEKEAAGLEGAVQVFALVMPPVGMRNTGITRTKTGYGAGQPVEPDALIKGLIINEAIFAGGRLLRVTGGGGGWGKKQGLLSLDANVNFSGGENSMASMFPAFEDDTTSESLVTPEELLPPGYTIQFYATWVGQRDDRLLPAKALDEFQHTRISDKQWWFPVRQNCILGTTIAKDAIPGSEIPADAPLQERKSRVLYKRGVFGMLSYGGLCIAREKVQDEDSIYKTLSPKSSTVHEFRIDVPNTVLQIYWQPPETGMEHPNIAVKDLVDTPTIRKKVARDHSEDNIPELPESGKVSA